jgi:signal-transduction protein with cAMP-binding, CBS, and nucleotidyltransferase domain
MLPYFENLPFLNNSELNHSDRLDIARSIRITNVQKGERLFSAGEVREQFYVIVKGKVGIFYPSKEYNAIKEDEDSAQRLICVSAEEATALRTQEKLREFTKNADHFFENIHEDDL